MRIGVHVSIGKGIDGAVTQAVAAGCEGFQIFAGSPRGWARKPLEKQAIAVFQKQVATMSLDPVVVHASYLPNPATEDETLYQKSLENLTEDFVRANLLGATYFVLHPGRSKERPAGIRKVTEIVGQLLGEVPGPTQLLFENQSGGSHEIAANFGDLKLLLAGVGQPGRTGVCFDTCHAFAAGYDLRNAAGWERTLEEFDQQIGLGALKLFHLNDSKGTLGSTLDRHQHIGTGNIGLDGFAFLVRHKELQKLPGILETPQTDPGDDRRNLTTLRALMGKDTAPARQGATLERR